MPAQLLLLMVTSSFVRRTTLATTTTLTKLKKSQKPKIPGTLSIKKAVAKAKHSAINDFVDDLANVVGFIFCQNVKDQVEYKDRALVYHYRLFFILYKFNQAELDVLFSINLPSFYSRCDKNGKKALKNAFESAYHHVKYKLIENIIDKTNLWLETLQEIITMTNIFLLDKIS